MVKIAEATGSKVDNVVKLELLKREDEAIQLEKKLILEEMAKSEARAVKEEIVTPASEILVDKAPTLKDKAPISKIINFLFINLLQYSILSLKS